MAEGGGGRHTAGRCRGRGRGHRRNRVDDRGSFPNPNLIKVDPGEHRLVVQGPAPGWAGGPPLHVMMLNVEPCKRYYINAQFDNTITQQWAPVVDYVEPIGDCTVPGKVAAK